MPLKQCGHWAFVDLSEGESTYRSLRAAYIYLQIQYPRKKKTKIAKSPCFNSLRPQNIRCNTLQFKPGLHSSGTLGRIRGVKVVLPVVQAIQRNGVADLLPIHVGRDPLLGELCGAVVLARRGGVEVASRVFVVEAV